MLTIRHLIIDFIFVITFFCSLESHASLIDSESNLSRIVSNEMCMDEMFQSDGGIEQSVLRTTYEDNGTHIKYEVIVTEDGEAYILKDNSTKVKLLTYTSGDYFSALLKPTVFEIYQNNTLVYSQSVSATVSFQSSSAYIEDKLKPVVYDYIDGFCGGETKCASSTWGNAGFVSKNVLKQSDDGEIKWVVRELNANKMLGLGSYTTSKHYGDFEYAVYQATGSRFRIYESGRLKVTGSNVSLGDVVKIKKIANRISYYLNDRLIYTSPVLVTKDLHILGSIYSTNALIQNVEASFTEDHQLYTTATVSKYEDEINWNNLKHYAYSTIYNSMVSTSRTSSAISENYYQADLGHNPVTIMPKLSKLFTPKHINRDVKVVVGVKVLEAGNYLEEEISYDRILSGFVFERNRGNQRVYILREGNIIQEIPGFEENKKYRISINGTRLNLELEDRGRYQIFHSLTINSNEKHVVYQGVSELDNPFIDVGISGFEPSNFVNYAYHYDGEDNLLEYYNGNIQDVLTETKQKDIIHKIGWHNLQNVKKYTSNVTVRESIEQDNSGVTASGESVYRFNPTDEYKISFIYSGGDFSLGSKPILSSPLSPYISGFDIKGGNISLVNGGSNINTTSISSGANVALLFNGNSTMSLQVNGSTIGSPVTLPASVLNLGMNLSQGALPSGIALSAVNTPPAPVAAAIVGQVHDIFQGNYVADCLAPGDLSFRLQPNQLGNYYVTIYDFDISNTSHIDQFVINVTNINSSYSVNLGVALEPGVYRYTVSTNGLSNGKYFSVGTTVKWNEGNSNALHVDFDDPSYLNIPSLSSIIPLDISAYSYSVNESTTDKSFSQSLPVLIGGNDEYEMEVTDGITSIASTKIISTPTSANVECYLNGSTTPFATFPVPTNGMIEQVFVMASPGFYKIGWYYSENGYRELMTNSGVINISSSAVKLNLKWYNGSLLPLQGFEASYCLGTPTLSGIIKNSKLILEECAPEFKLWYYNKALIDYSNPNQCPTYGVELSLHNLEPNTTYRLNSFQVGGGVEVLNYSTFTHPNNQPNSSVNYDFTTDANGESVNPIIIDAFVSQVIYDNSLKFELLNYSSGSPVSELYDFVLTDEYSGITENLINCYSYKTIYYDCFFDEEGDIEVKRELSDYPEVPDYDWSDNSSNESAYNEDLATGCYTVGLGYDFICGMPEVYLPYKILAQTIWANVATNYAGSNPNATYDEPTNNLFNAGGTVSNAVSLNALDYTIDGLIWYRNVYDNTQSGQFGYYNEETGTYFGVSISPNIDPTVDYTHALKVYISNPGIGYHDILNPNFINLNQFEFIEFKKENVNGIDETDGINLVLNIYPEFSTTSGEVTPRNTYTFFTEQLTSKSYQLFASPSLNNKLGEFGLNFCPPPVDKYFAIMSRNLHDGRHELKTCLSKDGYTACPIEIKNDCGLIDGIDLLKFKFDEDYYRSLSPTEILNFEVRDYQDNIVVSSTSGLANTLVKLGDNRYQLSMSVLNSIHPFYTLIVKNAKDEKRYLRFKK